MCDVSCLVCSVVSQQRFTSSASLASLLSLSTSLASASFSLSTLLPGSHGLTGVYGGDASYLTSTSSSAGPALTFTSAVPNTIRDTAGNGTGFTTRLPGTGGSIAVNDPNFTLNPGSGTLTWRTVASDLNGQGNLAAGDYMGFPLSAAGVTLNQDFTVSATFRNLQFGLNFDQIGIFVGTSSSTALGVPT